MPWLATRRFPLDAARPSGYGARIVRLPGASTRRGTAFSVAVLGIASCLAFASPTLASSVRVGPDYFGVNFQRVWDYNAALRGQHFAEMHALGFHQVHINLAWEG